MFNGFFSRHHRDHGEQIMDRYIPHKLSSHAFHSDISSHHSTHTTHALPYLDDTLLNLNHTSLLEGESVLRGSNPSPKQGDSHLSAIRDALNFSQGRVLSFTLSVTPPVATSPYRSRRSSVSASSHSPAFAHSPTMFRGSNSSASSSGRRTSIDSISDISIMTQHTPKKDKKKKKIIRRTLPYKVLDAQDLRNDYYTNVVSWSKETNRVAVGLGNICYVWSEQDEIQITRFLVGDNEVISVVSFSEGDLFLVATKSGIISLFSQELQINISNYSDDKAKGFCSIAWIPGSLNKFYAGNEEGDVMYFEITEFGEMKFIHSFQCNGQQVCGLAISQDGKEIATGCNENCCTTYDISDPQRPIMKQIFHHLAAVKAVTYCPWTKSLLATGGGQRDRTIKFWHTTSGTLLDTINAKGQVTSLMWCSKKKQIIATYGFADMSYPIIAESFTYPRLERTVEVVSNPSNGPIRALAACLSPDNNSILIAANDLTVRFYEIYDPGDTFVTHCKDGVFGSELIELQEGITRNGGYIR